jgi:hypothetical protein
MAVLGGEYRFEAAVSFPEGRWRTLKSFAPQILAGSFPDLQLLANAVFKDPTGYGGCELAVFTLVPLGQPPVSPRERNLLWRAFQVPIYEVLIDRDSSILAAECEAHDGWHLRHPDLRFDLRTSRVIMQRDGLQASPEETGYSAKGLDNFCGCGDPAPILREIRLATADSLSLMAGV